MSAGKLTGLKQFGPRQAMNICKGIERAKNVRLGPLLFACGIYGVEEEEAWLLAEKFKSLEALYDASVDSLLSHGFLNESVAVNAYNFFRHPANVLALTELQEKAGLEISNVEI
ncbi:DNA ligase [Klebsiella pneumoniae]|nr:DNA ligase [Klebsiella pneumoniae]